MTAKFAFIFPGQGSQSIGMGKAIYDEFAPARSVFEEVDEALREKLSDLIFSGDIQDLTLTANVQPALMCVSMAVIRVLRSLGFRLGEHAVCVAGHSLGEYSALAAAEALSLTDTARLLRRRGQAMQEAVALGEGSMAAILGASLSQAQEFASQAEAHGEICSLANDNAPGQVVVSGHKHAVERAMLLAKQAGIRKSVLLPVSAPFHCSLMQSAADAMREALAEVSMASPCVPLVANVSADLIESPQAIKESLVQQVASPVRWRESVARIKALGATILPECGAGKVLCGLTKRIDADLQAVNIQTPQDIRDFLENVV